ncbi:MAG TPA: hypothetical protein DEQ02_06405 [Ruminococcaceae bacterium]|nr:hypothetical protein [Oscillospiraceae bacterium]
MKKLLIYPFTKELCPIVRYRGLLSGYELVAAIPLPGYGWEGTDVGRIDGGPPTDFLLGGDFQEKLNQCDAVFLRR